jgi:hypothetical protein
MVRCGFCFSSQLVTQYYSLYINLQFRLLDLFVVVASCTNCCLNLRICGPHYTSFQSPSFGWCMPFGKKKLLTSLHAYWLSKSYFATQQMFYYYHPLRKIATRKKLVFSCIHKKDEMNITFILINIIVICFNRKFIFYLCVFMPLHIWPITEN